MKKQKLAIAIFHGLGDCTNATTLLKPLAAKHKNCEITWITSEKYAPLVKHNPYVSKVISIPGNVWKADAKYGQLKSSYKGLITPAPYMNPLSKNKILVESFKERIERLTGVMNPPLEPLLYITKPEVDRVKTWLKQNDMDKYVMLETKFTSSQSSWNNKHTKLAIELLGAKGYKILLTHRKDKLLKEYNKITPTYCMNFGFRYTPPFYNNAAGFIGVSSGISCLTHTNQCKKDIIHLEFVRGEHWCTRLYEKSKKTIRFDMNMLKPLIEAKF